MSLVLFSYALVLLFAVLEVYALPLNPVNITDMNKAKEYGVGTAALICCTVSLVASLVCMYWFVRMQKRFRHRLVMILIYGDVMRGTWLFVFAILSLARGTVSTKSTFCQVSGWLVQYGTQTSDYAVLVMALHSAIQVFYPSTMVSSDGLYSCRRYVYILGFILPALMASLAFVNSSPAYVSQGSFCTLPIRPFWYRLALTWVPRYIIVLTIIGIAIAIYAHVGFEFRAYSNAESSFHSFKTSEGSNTTQTDAREEPKMEDITFELHNMQPRPQPERRKSSIGHDIFTAQRLDSSSLALSPTTSSTNSHRVSFDSSTMSRSLPGSTWNLVRPSRADSIRPALLSIPSGQSITAPVSPLDLTPRPPRPQPNPTDTINPTTDHDNKNTSDPDPSITALPPFPPTDSDPSDHRPTDTLTKRRQRIHRQLRLMFIYPLAYTLMWLIPFAMHCMNYWNRWAMHPVEFLRVGASICITLMGFVDALIFSLREKPWQGIESSDGTFWGSFALPRRRGRQQRADGEEEDGQHEPANGHRGSASARSARGRGSQSYRTSASGEFARVAAEQARVRLEMEKEERIKALGSRRKSSRGGAAGDEDVEGGDDWAKLDLNVGDGGQGQVYDDNGLEDDTLDTEWNRRRK